MDANFNSLVEEQKEDCGVSFPCTENSRDMMGSENDHVFSLNSFFEDSRTANEHSLEKLAELTAAMNRFELDIVNAENPARIRSNSEPTTCPGRSPMTVVVTSCDPVNQNFAGHPVPTESSSTISGCLTPPAATSERRRNLELLPSRGMNVSKIAYDNRYGLLRHIQEQWNGKSMVDSNTPNGEASPGYVWNGEVPPRNYSNPTFSRKIFVGGVPWDITETALVDAFSRYGVCRVEWPSKDMHSRSHQGNRGKVTGYVYIVFETERSVKSLLHDCSQEFGSAGEWYFKLKARRNHASEIRQVQIIPWVVSDSSYIGDPNCRLDPTKTVFVGALHGMITAHVLFSIMNDLYGNVVFAGIDTDKHKYPIGSGRVTFRSHYSYFHAIESAFLEIRTSKFCKKVQIDPFLEDSLCMVCCKYFGPYFCRDRTCFRYYCDACWQARHTHNDIYAHHRPLMRHTPRSMMLRNDKNNINVGPHNLSIRQRYLPVPGKMVMTPPLGGVAAIAAVARGTVPQRQQHNVYCMRLGAAYPATPILLEPQGLSPNAKSVPLPGIKTSHPVSNSSPYNDHRFYSKQ